MSSSTVDTTTGLSESSTPDNTKVSKRQSFTLEKFKQYKAKPKPELLIVHSYPNLVRIKRAIGEEPDLDLDSQSKTTFYALAQKSSIHKKIGYIMRILARNPNEKVSEYLVYSQTSFAKDRKNNPITELFETVGMDKTADIIVTYDNNDNELPPKLGVEQDLYTIPWTGKDQVDKLLEDTGQDESEIQWIFRERNHSHGNLSYQEMFLPIEEVKARTDLGIQNQFGVDTKIAELPAMERLKLRQYQK